MCNALPTRAHTAALPGTSRTTLHSAPSIFVFLVSSHGTTETMMMIWTKLEVLGGRGDMRKVLTDYIKIYFPNSIKEFNFISFMGDLYICTYEVTVFIFRNGINILQYMIRFLSYIL
jgi:hypothetical protein